MASTTDEDTPHDCAPTSWPSDIEQLTSGMSGHKHRKRLSVISTGNTDQSRFQGAAVVPSILALFSARLNVSLGRQCRGAAQVFRPSGRSVEHHPETTAARANGCFVRTAITCIGRVLQYGPTSASGSAATQRRARPTVRCGPNSSMGRDRRDGRKAALWRRGKAVASAPKEPSLKQQGANQSRVGAKGQERSPAA
jgi:hypothetical protein